MMAVRPSRKSSPVGTMSLNRSFFLAVVIQRSREGRAEAGDVRAAFDRVDVVHVGVHVFGVFAGVLQGDFEAHAVVLAGDVDDIGMQWLRWRDSGIRRTRRCRVRSESCDTPVCSSFKKDLHAAVQERQLLQAAEQNVVENFVVWKICGSGLKVVFVPISVVAPTRFTGAAARPVRIPAETRGRRGGLRPRTIRERKLTTVTPTPCKPPEV